LGKVVLSSKKPEFLTFFKDWAQANFKGQETFLPKFWELLKLRIWQQVTGKDWGKVASRQG